MEAAQLQQALSKHFGYPAFRPGQEQIVRSVLSGRPTIAILPTGGGKSLCYQLPALLLEGTTVVVSPLVALMKDQVDALNARGIAATFINSSLGMAEQQERQAGIRRGQWRLVYVAPERFRSGSFAQAIAGVRVPLLAIDEAHCISAWGHDFRPEYQRLAQARAQLGAERILALTATATPEVRDDIARALELEAPRVFVAGFDRPNLFIEVVKAAGDKDKLGRILALARKGGPGLVYAATRKNVEKVVGALRAHGVDALGYHAGMGDAERTGAQERFLRGEADVVVATNAFGMGVDKSDIRFVAHYDIPRSLEAYYQEIGRAGRDGKDSLALLLFNFADVMMQRRMIDNGRPSRELVESVWTAARSLGKSSIDELAARAGTSVPETHSAARLLESAGHLERGRGQRSELAVVTPHVAPEELAVDFELLALRVARERQMLDRLVRFTDTNACRRQNLLRYFGDLEVPRGCSSCDACVGPRAPIGDPVAAAKNRTRAVAGPSPAEEPLGPAEAQVFEALRAMRLELSREAKVPPYVIFHDATLRELARAMPDSEPAFLAVKGAGPSRWQRYGDKVLAITAPARAARKAVAPAPPLLRKGSRPASQDSREPPANAGLMRSATPSKPAYAGSTPSAPGESTPDAFTRSTSSALAAGEGPPLQIRELHLQYGAATRGAATRIGEVGGGFTRGQPGSARAGPRLSAGPGEEVRSAQAVPHWLQEGPPLAEESLQPAPAPGAPSTDGAVKLCAEGDTLALIAEKLQLPVAEVASQLADALRAGRGVDVKRVLGAERLAAIRAAAEGAGSDLVAVRKRLPFPAALAEIRLALLA